MAVASFLARLESIMRMGRGLSTRPAKAVPLHKMIGGARHLAGPMDRFVGEYGHLGLNTPCQRVIHQKRTEG
jgi:hypothetical protein